MSDTETFAERVVRRARALGWEVDPSSEHDLTRLQARLDDTARSLIAEIGKIKARASALEELLQKLIARLA